MNVACVSGDRSILILFFSLEKSLRKSNTAKGTFPATVQCIQTKGIQMNDGIMRTHVSAHTDEAGQKEMTVEGDSVSYSLGVTSFAAGCRGSFGPCLYRPSGPGGLRCEQIPCDWFTDIFPWYDSTSGQL